ncbi:ABC transporter permease [Parvibaculum sp.]|uniref:ABC transporter permease n=1 Tax=Parvibaculum sp. TaxID=2024848 RepID=UPI00320F9BBE
MQLKLEPRGFQSKFWSYASPVLAILLTIVTMAIIFLVLGKDPGISLYTFLIEPIVAENGAMELLVKAAPLILMGVGISLAYRANVWDIGAEGEFTIGALFGGGVGLAFPDLPFDLLFPAMLISGVIGGMLWALIVALLRTRFNANEILTSLMLTYIAQLILIYMVTGPWRDPQGFGFPQTAMFSANATNPTIIEGTRLHLGIFFALAAAAAGWLLLTRSLLGFQLRVQGFAPRAARFAGFRETRLVWTALALTGGLAGLAGTLEVSGPIGQLTPQISPGYGYTAIIVAFLGRLHPLGVVFAALLLGLSYLGGEAAQIELALPSAVTGIFQGVLLFYLLGCDTLILYRLRIRSSRPAAARA